MNLSRCQRPRRAVLVVVAALVLFAAAAGSAHAQQGARVTVRNVDPAAFPKVSVVVDVTDSRGLPLGNLLVGDLSVMENGKSVVSPSLRSQVDAKLPLSIILLVDTSGSMLGAPLQSAKTAASTFLDQLASQDQVAVIVFSQDVREVQGFSTDRQATRATLNGLTAAGNTRLYDGMYSAADMVARSKVANAIVVLLSDGEDTRSEKSLDSVMAVVSSRAVPFYTVGLGSADMNVLGRVAEATGGDSLYAPAASALTSAYQQIAQRLRSFYVLTYTTPNVPGPPERTLEVKVQREQTVGTATFVLDLPSVQLSIKNLAAGDRLSDQQIVQVVADHPEWVSELRFSLDKRLLKSVSAPPFELVFNPVDFKPGDHTLEVTAQDVIQREVSLSVPFVVSGFSPGGAPVESASKWSLGLRWLGANSPLPLALLLLVLSTLALARQGIARWQGVRCPSCNRRYHARGGCPVCNHHFKVETQRLGEILVRAGLVTMEQLETALKTSIAGSRLLGGVLVEGNYITREHLRKALRVQEKRMNFALRLRNLFEMHERSLASGGALLVYAGGVVLGMLFLYLYSLSQA